MSLLFRKPLLLFIIQIINKYVEADMTILQNYKQFYGLHWETGTVRNFWDYRGVRAPHTGQAISEALLLGISGGIVMGYFSFAYEGYDPMARILTRNTFDPWVTMLSRLGVEQEIRHTSKPDKAIHNLTDTLAAGTPAIVWADMYSLPYNTLPYDEGMWAMFPILVYGYDEADNMVWLADRARVPLTVTTADLHTARARVKKDKFRIITLSPPNWDRLATATTTTTVATSCSRRSWITPLMNTSWATARRSRFPLMARR
jgi:hypothetical protein